jgi:hypothetical protein
MANIPAILANSDFSLPATWSGGVVPGPGDVAYANGNTVFVSDSRTVQAVSNAVGSGITAGGTFSLLNGCNLTCTNANGVIQSTTVATSCITTLNLGPGSSATLAAFVTQVASGAANSITFSTSGTLTTIGNLVGATTSGGFAALAVSGTGTLNHVGNINGGSSNSGVAALNVTGNALINITGSLTGGTLSGLNNPALALTNGVVSITGSVTGGASPGIFNNGGNLTVNGPCQSSAIQPAIAAGTTSQITRLSGPFLLGATGNINPVQAASWRWAPTLIPTYMEVAQSNGSTKRLLYSADNMPTGGYPVAANVRATVVYGPSNEFSGTLVVAPPSSIALGVPTDNTVGTAVLTQANVLAALGTIGNLDAQLANKATVDQVAAIVQGATSA